MTAQEPPGISRSVARGSVCVTFGPDITRRFCEINRLRMIIRSHEVPRSMSGVAVQHEGRLITVFSASNYCGRIGNSALRPCRVPTDSHYAGLRVPTPLR